MARATDEHGSASLRRPVPRATRSPSTLRWVLWLAALSGIVLLISSAWLSEDAYITLRTIDNVWSGYGLRWNAMERVQAYTHPLWMMLIAAAYGLTREAFLTTLALSFACTIGAAAIVATRIAPTMARALIALACLLGSKAFVEFSTSGLENPLSHLLLAWFCWEAWRDSTAARVDGADAMGTRASPPRVRRLSFIASLCALTRLDLLVLIAPMLLLVVIRVLREEGAGRRATGTIAGALAVGLLPFVAWELFSLIYYGFAFPNTAYAKLATGIPRSELIAQGLFYLLDSLTKDPITLPIVLIASAWAIARKGDRIIGVSLACALFYVIAVGGDFMSGRFLSPAFFVAVAWLCRTIPLDAPRHAIAIAAAITIISAIAPRSPWRVWHALAAIDSPIEHGHGIVDERTVYYAHTGLMPFLLARSSPASHPWAAPAVKQRGFPRVQVYEAVGLLGYYSGPGVHIIDPMALPDPLLARQPALTPWRIGHFRRDVPDGYAETVERCLSILFPNGRIAPPTVSCVESPDRLNTIRDPRVAALYDRLSLITQGALFDPRRLRAILEMNLGLAR
jgi:arabinofuranosyltransferase